jgi:hypothetical protein
MALTRRVLLGKGLLATLALASAGRFALPDLAFARAADCARGSRSNCLLYAAKLYRKGIRECDGLNADPVTTLGCYRSNSSAWKAARRICKENCPPPAKPPSKPPSGQRRKTPPPPPPLPPNPYDGLAIECANCAQVGGKCCYGSDPKHLCACANPDYPCQKYGCSA